MSVMTENGGIDLGVLSGEERKAVEVVLKCRDDVSFFAKMFFPHIVNRPFCQAHLDIFDSLKTANYFAGVMPRGHGKSTLGLILYSIHYALFRAVGDISLISASEQFILNEIVRPIKLEFESNEMLKQCFGELKTHKWSETYFVIKNGVAFEAGGIGGQLRGGRRGLICLDDLEDDESVNSEDQRTKLRNRINKELIPKLLPGGQIIYFGTPISTLSYIWNLFKNEKGWVKRHYDCYKDGIEAAGHELWPEMLPHKLLQERKERMGTFAFQAEYRCNPVSEATAAIKEEQIRNWDNQPSQMSVVIAVDPAYSEDPKADFKCASVVGADAQGNRYLLTYLNTHVASGEFIDAILNLFLQFKNVCTGVGLPRGGGDTEFWQSFVRRMEERKISCPLVELKNTFVTAGGAVKTNKKSRSIAALQPLFQSGKYYIHANHIEAREQLLQLNPVTDQEHDDIIDTMTYAEQIITPAYFDTGMGIEDENVPVRNISNYGMD